MFTIISGIVLYASGLIILDRSLHHPVQTSMLYDLIVFQAGCLLIVTGAYFSAIHRSRKRRAG